MSAELREAAIEAARLAGAVLREKLAQARTVAFKGEGRLNLVTDADHASERVLLDFLRARFPDHAILAEESGAAGHSEHTWFIDPLDGTTNYAHGVPHFCVTLAVEGPAVGSASGMLAGVVYDPVRDELFAAAHGAGATLNGRPISVSGVSTLDGALLCTGFPYDLHEHPTAPLGLFNRLITQAQGVRRMGSAALDLAYVACGRFDGFFEFGLKPWDIAAGALLIAEAGGAMTQLDGAPFDVRVGDILAAGGALRPALERECGAFARQIGWRARRFEG